MVFEDLVAIPGLSGRTFKKAADVCPIFAMTVVIPDVVAFDVRL
jgi:hypothetical protein